ncbi:MAG: biopolymer transporter ExbD [Anaerolineales bacterium]|nr:biopolymer transporter ExbD [Anaerolineales bacterium]
MARVHHYRRRRKEAPELEMTTFLNLMVVLVPFLLITAVFSRITIAELDLPSAISEEPSAPTFRVEVVLRGAGLEIMDGSRVVLEIPKTGGAYDLEKLSDYLVAVKGRYPDKEDASVLLEPDIPYDHLIQVMDAVRSFETHDAGEKILTSLFPAISIGDAP